jgi:hypothetical protein
MPVGSLSCPWRRLWLSAGWATKLLPVHPRARLDPRLSPLGEPLFEGLGREAIVVHVPLPPLLGEVGTHNPRSAASAVNKSESRAEEERTQADQADE